MVGSLYNQKRDFTPIKSEDQYSPSKESSDSVDHTKKFDFV